MTLDQNGVLSHAVIVALHDETGGQDLSRVAKALEKAGATVLDAHNLATAKEFLRAIKVDMIVADLDIAPQDGVALLRWASQQPAAEGGGVPAVAIGTAARGNDIDYVVYFCQPLDVDDFITTIAMVLGRRRNGA
jgi:DNA-binding response OmpR family regulator